MRSDRWQLLARLADRASVPLSGLQLEQIEHYLELLSRWNRTINLTALPLEGFPESTLERLVLEPLLAVEFVTEGPLVWLDLGSGGGSPAFPIKIARPSARLTMVEARGRKAAFLREVVRALGLVDATVAESRLEALEGQRRSAVDLITVRGLRLDLNRWKVMAGVVRPGGRVLLFRRGLADLLPESLFVPLASRPLNGRDNVLEVLVRTGAKTDCST